MILDIYKCYRHELACLANSGQLMPYDWSPLPDVLDVRWLPYSQMLCEFARELANAINNLTDYARRLTAWSKVVHALSDEAKPATCRELIDPLAIVAVSLPYVIKARFAFAIAHLCHQANRGRQGEQWKDNLPLDNTIQLDTAEKLGRDWPSFAKLKARLDNVNSKKFRRDTHDFRNAYTHRLSPRFVIGITHIVTRHVDSTKAVSYAFGGIEALDLGQVSALLATQCDHCYSTYDAFQELVHEHVAMIKVAL